MVVASFRSMFVQGVQELDTLTLYKYYELLIEPLKICTYRQVDGKSFNLWDISNLRSL